MNGNLWTEEEIEVLRRGVLEGDRWEVIAARLERTDGSVYQKALALDFVGPLSEDSVSDLRARWAERLPRMKAAIREEVERSGLTI